MNTPDFPCVPFKGEWRWVMEGETNYKDIHGLRLQKKTFLWGWVTRNYQAYCIRSDSVKDAAAKCIQAISPGDIIPAHNCNTN